MWRIRPGDATSRVAGTAGSERPEGLTLICLKKGFKSDVHFQFVLVLSCYLNKILWALVTLFWPNTNRTTYLVENVCSYKTKT